MTAPRPTARLRPKTDTRALRGDFPGFTTTSWCWTAGPEVSRPARWCASRMLSVGRSASPHSIPTAGSPRGCSTGTPRRRSIGHGSLPDCAAPWRCERRCIDAPFYRLVHAEADGLPGVVIDRFGDVASIQPNAAWAEVLLEDLAAALADTTGVTTIVKNAGGRARAAEGLDDATTVLQGAIDGSGRGSDERRHLLRRRARRAEDRPLLRPAAQPCLRRPPGARRFGPRRLLPCGRLRPCGAGRRGYRRACRRWLRTRPRPGARAARGPAALPIGSRRGGATPSRSWPALDGATFGTVVCDPPAFAPSKPALEAGLRAYEKVARLAARLVAPDGFLVLCSCSHAADLARFRDASLRGVGRAGRRAQILHVGFAGPDHPTHPALAESGYLKALFLRLE